MNLNKFKKNSKRGITPVIATIILIAVTLVLALVVGAYVFGLFGSNAKTITLTSALLSSGGTATSLGGACSGANFQLTFNNPGGETYISALSLSSGGNPVSLTYYAPSSGCTSTSALGTSQSSAAFVLNAGVSTSVDPYFGLTGANLNSGSTYNYVITFGNGQTISGTIIAE